jgi:RimJ/RimL family protein N-acetyltransferase
MAGEKVVLSPIEKEDVRLFQRWINDLVVTRYTRPHQITTLESEKQWFKRIISSKDDATFAIVDKKSGRTIGNVSLMKISNVDGNAEFGIMIGDKNYWGKGYGTEAAKLILDFGFNVLRLHEIYLRVKAFNKRAVKAYEKAGFKPAGVLRQNHFFAGKYHDVYLMDVLDKEFKSSAVKELLDSSARRQR